MGRRFPDIGVSELYGRPVSLPSQAAAKSQERELPTTGEYSFAVGDMPPVNLEGALPSNCPVLPLKSTVVFPRIFIPLSVGRKKSLQLLEDLTGVERHIAVATQLEETAEDVGFK